MKNTHLYITLILFLGITTVVNAQLDGLKKHWSFDEDSRNKDYSSLFVTSESIAFSSGVAGQSVSLFDKNYSINVGQYIDLEDAFSVVFWFNVLETEGLQSLLLQSKTKENGGMQRYLQLVILNGQLLLKNEKENLAMYHSPEIQSNSWHQLTYTYNGFEAKIYLDKTLIYQSTETSIFTKLPCCYDALHIGKAANTAVQFKGYVDEMMIFEEAFGAKEVEALNLKINQKPLKIEVDTPKIFVSQPVQRPEKIPNQLSKKTDNRLNDLQDSLTVTTQNIEFDIWDYDEFDEDKVRFVWNAQVFSTNVLLDKKRKARRYNIPTTLDFKTNDTNFLIFYAEDMGKFSSQNTAAVQFWIDGERQEKIYKLVLTERQNAVLKITHSGKIVENELITAPKYKAENAEKPFLGETTPTTEIIKNQHELTVSDTILTIKIMDNSIVDGDSVTILHNGKVILEHYGLTKNWYAISIQLAKNQVNNFTFIPISMGSKDTQNTALVIIEANEKIIDKVTLSSSDENHPAKLIITHRF